MASQLHLDAPLDLDSLDVDDAEASESLREILLDRFGEWMVAGERPGVEWAVAEALRFKADFLDGRLGSWRAGDLAEILTEWFPRKVSADEANVALVCPTLRAFFTWLDEAELLDGDGDPLPVLLATLDRVEPGLVVAMADESMFGMAKSVTRAMLDDGVALDDEGAVREWIAGFNSRATVDPLPRPTLPPMAVPDDVTLTRLVADTPAMARLATLVDWVGDGRRLTRAGNLRLRDARQLVRLLGLGVRGEVLADLGSAAHLTSLELAFRWALAADFLETDGHTVVRGDAADLLTAAPLDAWRGAFVALLSLGVVSAGMTGWVPFWVEPLDELAGMLLARLHTHGAASVDELAADALAEITDTFDLSDVTEPQRGTMADAMPASVGLLVDRLAQAGAVEVAEGRVDSAPLGRWFLRQLLRARGVEVPDVAATDAAGLLAACVDWDGAMVGAAVEQWVAGQRPESAAEQLAAAAVGSDDARVRVLAFAALELIGAPAEPAVRGLRAHPDCWGFAAVWLTDNGFDERRPLNPCDGMGALVGRLGVLLAGDGPNRMVEELAAALPPDDQHAVVAELWRHDDPAVPLILDALAAHAPKPVAKAAAKARFKQRSAAPPAWIGKPEAG
jgi:hypothetical protein